MISSLDALEPQVPDAVTAADPPTDFVDPAVPSLPSAFEMPEPRDRTLIEHFEQCELYTSKILNNKDFMPKAFTSFLVTHGSGLHRTLGAQWDKETWTAVAIRLATRAFPPTSSTIESDWDPGARLADTLRTQIFKYIVANFRSNWDFCSTWLNEEWYSTLVDDSPEFSKSAYEKWTHRVLDAVLPFLEPGDRSFMRFLSDLPALTKEMILKIRTLCDDPDRSQLGYTTFQ